MEMQNELPNEILSRLLTPEEAGAFLGIKPSTLSVWRATHRYPDLKFVVIGGRIRYDPQNLQDFVNGRTSNEHGQTPPEVKRRPAGAGRPSGAAWWGSKRNSMSKAGAANRKRGRRTA